MAAVLLELGAARTPQLFLTGEHEARAPGVGDDGRRSNRDASTQPGGTV